MPRNAAADPRLSLAHSRRCDLRGSTALGFAPKPLVAALFWPLNSKLGGVAAPGWRSRGAAPLRRICRRAMRGARPRRARWALGAWGPSPEACRVQAWLAAVARRFCASRRGTERGQLQVTGSDMRAQQQSIPWCPVAGPPHHTTSHQTMTATVMYWPVSPRPPSPIINLTTLIPSI